MKLFTALLTASFLLTTGCTAMTESTQVSQSQSTMNAKTEKQAQWPLRFRTHNYTAYTYSTFDCKIIYGDNYYQDDSKLQIASSAVKSYPDNLVASKGPNINFPPPAQVTWKSKDGTPLSAQIDMAKIFADGLIRHNLQKDEISENTLKSDHSPGIILEVNDRTINVYMRAFLSTKTEQRPGNKHSNFRNDLVKAFSQTY